MASYMLINKSGSSFDVYDNVIGGSIAGTIYNREVFVETEDEGSSYHTILFLGPNGQLKTGRIFSYFLDDSALTPITNCPYMTENINGTNYKVFKFRRSESIYLPNGDHWGSVASGMKVACLSDKAGKIHPQWKAINYVMRSTDNQWIKVESSGCDFGFVNTGLEDGSTPNSISMYRSWDNSSNENLENTNRWEPLNPPIVNTSSDRNKNTTTK